MLNNRLQVIEETKWIKRNGVTPQEFNDLGQPSDIKHLVMQGMKQRSRPVVETNAD